MQVKSIHANMDEAIEGLKDAHGQDCYEEMANRIEELEMAMKELKKHT